MNKIIKLAAYTILSLITTISISFILGLYISWSNYYFFEKINESNFIGKLFWAFDLVFINTVIVMATKKASYLIFQKLSAISSYFIYNYYSVTVLAILNFIILMKIWLDPYYNPLMSIFYTVTCLLICAGFTDYPRNEWKDYKNFSMFH